MSSYQLRPADDSDRDFVHDVRTRTLAEYVSTTWGAWDDADQRMRFEEDWSPEQWEVIVVKGRDVGVLQVERDGDPVWLSNVELAPEDQRQGIGSAVIRDIIDHAHARGRAVRLQVLKANTAARRLYERIGFVPTGETATHMVLTAPVP